MKTLFLNLFPGICSCTHSLCFQCLFFISCRHLTRDYSGQIFFKKKFIYYYQPFFFRNNFNTSVVDRSSGLPLYGQNPDSIFLCRNADLIPLFFHFFRRICNLFSIIRYCDLLMISGVEIRCCQNDTYHRVCC